MNGDVLANDAAVPDAAVGSIALVLYVLRSVADDGVRVHNTCLADLRPARQVHVLMKPSARADSHMFINYAKGADYDIAGQFSLRMDDRRGMDRHSAYRFRAPTKPSMSITI